MSAGAVGTPRGPARLARVSHNRREIPMVELARMFSPTSSGRRRTVQGYVHDGGGYVTGSAGFARKGVWSQASWQHMAG